MTQQAKDNVTYSIATHAAEQMIPSRETVRLCEKIADGKLSGNEAVEEIKRRYGIDGKRTRG